MFQRYQAEFFLLLCTVLWGGTFVVIKITLEDTPPLLLVGLRFSLAALVFGALFARQIREASNSLLLKGLLLGLFMLAGFGLQTVGLGYTSVARSAFITQLLLVFTPALQIALFRRMPGRGTFAGIIIVLFGMFLLTAPESRAGLNFGDWLTLGCAVGFSLYILYIDRFATPANAAALSFFQSMFLGAFACVAALVFEDVRVKAWTPSLLLGLAYLSFLATNLVLYWQTRWQPETSPARASVIFAMEPVFATAFAVALLSEGLSGRELLGGGFIVIGMLVSELWRVPAPGSDLPP